MTNVRGQNKQQTPLSENSGPYILGLDIGTTSVGWADSMPLAAGAANIINKQTTNPSAVAFITTSGCSFTRLRRNVYPLMSFVGSSEQDPCRSPRRSIVHP